jgi:hypothetical protein
MSLMRWWWSLQICGQASQRIMPEGCAESGCTKPSLVSRRPTVRVCLTLLGVGGLPTQRGWTSTAATCHIKLVPCKFVLDRVCDTTCKTTHWHSA